MANKMEQREKDLREYLREGETVRWEGAPHRIALMDEDNKSAIIKRWIITAVITVVALGGYVGFLEAKTEIVILVAAIAIYNFLAPVEAWKAILKHQYFYVTDQRVILSCRHGAFYFMNFTEIDAVRVVTGLTGRKSLVIGSAIFPKCEKRLRWQCLHPKDDPDPMPEAGHVLGMVFYEPENVEEAIALLEDQVLVEYMDCGHNSNSGTKRAA